MWCRSSVRYRGSSSININLIAELEHAWQTLATQRSCRLFDGDQQIADIGAGWTCVHEVAGSFERSAGVELAPRSFDIATGDGGTFDAARIHDRARIARRPIGAVGPGGKQHPW